MREVCRESVSTRDRRRPCCDNSLDIVIICFPFREPRRVLADANSDDVALLEDSAVTLKVLLESFEEEGLIGAVDRVW